MTPRTSPNRSQPKIDSALLPCPFCGESRISLNKPGFNYKNGSINCPACLVVMPGEVNEAELVDCWNTRAPAVATGDHDLRAAVIEECAKIAEKWFGNTIGKMSFGPSPQSAIAAEIRALAQAPATDAAGGQS